MSRLWKHFRRPLRDRDLAEQAIRFRTVTLGLFGGVLGGLLGLFLSLRGGPAWLPGVLFLAGWVATGLSVHGIAQGAGRIARGLYSPDGSATPPKRGYSRIETLIVRGRIDEAAVELEALVRKHPEEPEGWFRLSRLLRQDAERPEEAVQLLLRALREPRFDGTHRSMARRELAELYLGPIGDRERGLRELRSLIREGPETPNGRWARVRLRDEARAGGS